MVGSIPEQIKEFKIILVKPRDKRPLELWSRRENQYSWNDKNVVDWLNGGGNYGIICGDGLVVFDFDNPKEKDVQKVVKFFGETFAVRSGSGKGIHLYYKIPGYDIRTTRVNLSQGHIDIRGNGSYVVGPGCIHPLGGTYDVVSDRPIRIIQYEKFIEFVGKEEKVSNIAVSIGEDMEDMDELTSIVMALPYRVRELILREWNPNDSLFVRYHSRSERDMAIIRELVFNNLESYIKPIFAHFPCGDKYREKGKFGDRYLEITLKKAFGNVNITNPEMRKLIRDVYLRVFSPKKYLMNIDTEQLIRDIASIDDENIRNMFIYELQKKGFKKLFEKIDYYRNSEYKSETSIMELLKIPEHKISMWIYPFVIKGGITMFAGAAGSMKSFLSLFLSLLAVSNRSVDGITVYGKPKILYYDLENSPDVVANRIHEMMRGMNISEKEIEDRLYVANYFTKPMLDKEIERAKKYDIIILDSYRRFIMGEESKSRFVNKFYSDFLLPLKKLGKSIVIIHHINKTGMVNIEEILDSTAVRGSTDIVAQLDLLYLIQRYKAGSSDKNKMESDVMIINRKDREGIGEHNFLVKFIYDKTDERWKTVVEIRETAAKSTLDYLSDKILEYVKEHPKIPRVRAVMELCDVLGRSRPRIYALIKDLIKQGFIKEDHGVLSANEVEQFVSGKDIASHRLSSEHPSSTSPEVRTVSLRNITSYKRSIYDDIVNLSQNAVKISDLISFLTPKYTKEDILKAVETLKNEKKVFECRPGEIKIL